MFKYFVYVIRGINSKNRTKFYIGFTNNLYRRIRQHNRELTGGAKATHGYKWSYCAIFANIDTDITGLQIEWRLKHSTKSYNIYNRIYSFFDYINQHKKPSPKSDNLKNKLFFYIDHKLAGITDEKINLVKSKYIFLFKCVLDTYVIDHLMEAIE